jgi:ATP-dependent DNA helicase RecG
VVLDADRFGVSQLHQLRGRVGRGAHASTCFLHTRMPPGSHPFERLSAVAATSDGAQLALLDLEQRREGDVLGVAQSGRRRTLRHLDLTQHRDVVEQARAEAVDVVSADPDLIGHPALRSALHALLAPADAQFLEKG